MCRIYIEKPDSSEYQLPFLPNNMNKSEIPSMNKNEFLSPPGNLNPGTWHDANHGRFSFLIWQECIPAPSHGITLNCILINLYGFESICYKRVIKGRKHVFLLFLFISLSLVYLEFSWTEPMHSLQLYIPCDVRRCTVSWSRLLIFMSACRSPAWISSTLLTEPMNLH
jgi:hypothetical protein